MNRLLYGPEDPKAMILDYVCSNEPCPHCYGNGEIYYFADTGEQITYEEYMENWFLNDKDREVIVETCEHCEGNGFIEVYKEKKFSMGRKVAKV